MVTEESLEQQQCEVHTDVRVTMDALDYEYNHDARTQWPRLSASRLLQLAVGGRGRGPSGQEEQRTQRASFVATSHTRHTQQQQQHQYVGHRGGLGCLFENTK